mgnify:CR=1 FL=1
MVIGLLLLVYLSVITSHDVLIIRPDALCLEGPLHC